MGLSFHVFCLEDLGCWMGPRGEDFFYHRAQKDPLFRYSGQAKSGTIKTGGKECCVGLLSYENICSPGWPEWQLGSRRRQR